MSDQKNLQIWVHHGLLDTLKKSDLLNNPLFNLRVSRADAPKSLSKYDFIFFGDESHPKALHLASMCRKQKNAIAIMFFSKSSWSIKNMGKMIKGAYWPVRLLNVSYDLYTMLMDCRYRQRQHEYKLNESKDHLSYAIHEMLRPIHNITSCISSLESYHDFHQKIHKELTMSLPTHKHKLIDEHEQLISYVTKIIQDNASYIDVISDNLRKLQDIDSQKNEIECSPSHPLTPFFKSFDLCLPKATRKGVKLRIERALPSEWDNIKLPLKHIQQILENLGSNAIKFSDTNTTVIFRAYKRLNHIIYEIEDQGCGIAPEHHKDIFLKYTRFNKREQGSGLGLYIVKKYADMIKGKISLDSELDVGSCFRISIDTSIDHLSQNIAEDTLVIDENIVRSMLI
jgi:signal transduction histidine kinase